VTHVPPIKLTDTELDAVLMAARPIAPDRRDAFLQQIADELGKLGDQLGPGAVHRVVRAVQRSYFDPPDITGVHGSKYA
jgi:hypothetical protein